MKRMESSGYGNRLLKKIRGITRSLLEDICIRRCFASIALDRYRNYCNDTSGNCCCSSYLITGQEILSIEREAHAHRLGILLRVLIIVQTLLQEKKHLSKRDIYYMHPSIFSEQEVVDQAIDDICILLECSRHNLNVVSAGKGFVMGWLRFVHAGRKCDCIRSPSTAFPVPVHVEEVKGVQAVSTQVAGCSEYGPVHTNCREGNSVPEAYTYVLNLIRGEVIQMFQLEVEVIASIAPVLSGRMRILLDHPANGLIIEIAEPGTHLDNKVIAGGLFLRFLIEKLHLPAYCLVDCDPYGFDILTTYRFGSMKMAYDAKLLSVPGIRWLGAYPSDCEKYHIPDHCLLPLTPKDKKKAKSILQRCYLHREAPQWRVELEAMLQRGVKFEIEALSVSSFSFLSNEYIPSKIRGGLII